MTFFQNSSIQRKQTHIIMLTTTVALLLACAALTAFEVFTFRHQTMDDLSTYACIIGNNVSAALDFNDAKAAQETLSALVAEPDIIGACVYAPDGTVFAQYHSATNGADFKPPQKIQNGGRTFGNGRLSLFQPIKSDGQVIGVIYLESSTRALRSQLTRYALISGGVLVATLLISLLLSSRLQRLVSRPILDLARAAQDVALNKNYSVRIQRRSTDEIGVLVEGFNGMLAQIQARDASLERRVTERTRELAESLSMLHATLGSTTDGILVRDPAGSRVIQNRRMVELWKVPPEIADNDDNGAQFQFAANATTDPDRFREKFRYFADHPDESSQDEIELKDGTIMERITAPVLGPDGKNYGRVWSFRDVTERRRVERQLAESRNFLDRIINTVADPVFVKDRLHRRALVNDVYCHFTGLKREELLGKTDHDLNCFSLAQADELSAKDDVVFKTGKENTSEEQLIAADGTVHYLITKKTLYTDEKGEQFIVGVSRDVTNQKKIEREIIESRALYTSLVEQLPAGVFRKDLNGCYVLVNSWFCRLRQLKPEQILGKTPAELAAKTSAAEILRHPQATELLRQGDGHHRQILQTGRRIEVEERYPGPDGQPLYLRVIKSPVSGPDGALIGSQGILMDVTERKRAEERLRRTEEIYRQAITGAGEVPYSYDYQTRTYSFVGAGIEELIGYSPAEMTPAVWQEITRESIMLGESAGMDRAAAAQKVLDGEISRWRCDMRVVTRSGEVRWIADASVQNLDEAGRPIGSMGILQDITERKQAEMVALAFSKLGRDLSSAASREEAARIIGDVAHGLFGWDAFWVQLYSAKEQMLYPLYNVDTIDGRRIVNSDDQPRIATKLYERLIQRGPELLLRKSPAFSPDAKPFGDTSRPSASLMFAPIRLGDVVVGFLSLQSYVHHAYSPADLKTLQTLADHCAGALERIRSDEARRETESQFKLVWEASVEGMRLADRDGNVVMANDAYCRLVEKSKEEVEGHPFSIVHCPENAQNVLSAYQERFNADSPHSQLEVEVTLWNGRKVWIELSNSILQRPGKAPLLLSILRDVTERKQAEIALAYERELLTGLLNSAEDKIYFKDLESRFIRCSASMARAFGVSKIEDMIGKHDRDFFLDEHANDAFQDEQKIIRTGQSLIGKVEKVTWPDGRITWALTTKMPLPDMAGNIVGTFGITKDITAIKLSEAELSRERNLLRTIIGNSPDSIYIKDLNGRKTMANPSELKNMGCKTEAEAVGKSDFEIYPRELAEAYFADDQAVMQTGQPLINREEKVVTPAGETLWFLSSKIPLHGDDGKIIGLVGLGRDVTAMKEAKTRLDQVHRQLLETSRQAGMAEVATSVLHNVGNVLNSINVSTTLVLDRVKKSRLKNLGQLATLIAGQRNHLGAFFTTDPRGQQLPDYLAKLAEHLTAEQSELMTEIELTRKNIEHIKDIVTMQQNYAKVSGVVEKAKATDLVEDALRMNAGALARHNLQVVRDYPTEAIELSVERQKVLQILVNLIRNAKYACDESGRPDKVLTLQVRPGDGHVHLVVMDNGVGIPAENLTRIFNHGFTTRENGHGFGLHSGALTAKELGGALTAHSDGPGAGARFVLELPLQPPHRL